MYARNEVHVIVALDDALVFLVVDLDTIATVILCRFTGNARRRQCVAFGTTVAEVRDSGANSNLQRFVALQITQDMTVLANGIGQRECVVDRAVGEQDDEVIVAKAGCYRIFRQVILDKLCKPDNDLVAGRPVEGVVDQLQVVEIELDKLVCVLVTVECLHRFVDLCLETGTVHKPGHRVE